MDEGASVVITHHITKGKEKIYEQWLEEISSICKAANGFIDWQIIRPIPAVTFVYTVIIRFNTIDNLKSWMGSPERERLINKARILFEEDDNYVINSGLDFLFSPVNAKPAAPVRWKQYLVTWSAIYPLSLLVSTAVLPILRSLNVMQNRFVDAIFVSGIVVLLMVYVIMPKYTKLIKSWLYK